MPLKHKLDSLEGLDEQTQKLYRKEGDKFVLDVEGIHDGDVVSLKNQVEKLLTEKKKVEDKLEEIQKKQSEAEEAAAKAAEEAAKKAGDIAALEKSWQAKHEKALEELKQKYESKIEKQEATLSKLLKTNVANSIAMEIGLDGHQQLLAKLILDRLGYEEVDGEYKTVVLDEHGKRSALSVDELKKEIETNKAFGPLIKGSNASGGGAGGGSTKGAGGAKKFSELTEAERVKLYRENKAEYIRLRDAERKAS